MVDVLWPEAWVITVIYCVQKLIVVGVIVCSSQMRQQLSRKAINQHIVIFLIL